MNIDEFINERKEEWERLEEIAKKIGPGSPAKMNPKELWELGKLYTAAVSDLAVLKSSDLASGVGNDEIEYLNSLVIRIHGAIYRKEPFRWSLVSRFLVKGFPETVREAGTYVFISTAVFAMFCIAGFGLGLSQPGFIELLVPESIISRVEDGRVWFDNLHTVAPMASSYLMTHNISVTFLIVAAGITFGVGTVYLLAVNGLLLGTVAALCFEHGLSKEFWSFVLPHGSLELSAICIAGAAGLVLGHAVADPGPYKRAEFLSIRGKSAGRLALGCALLLVPAGVIEAFFSPAPFPAWLKFVFAAVSFASLITYLLTGGRHIPETTKAGEIHPMRDFTELKQRRSRRT
ncbi:MAG: stage II sporulation protein M [Desulfomonilaceae bacterium]|nr:stage II sporulation protein M [Desulfomonilaceae bacterium]